MKRSAAPRAARCAAAAAGRQQACVGGRRAVEAHGREADEQRGAPRQVVDDEQVLGQRCGWVARLTTVTPTARRGSSGAAATARPPPSPWRRSRRRGRPRRCRRILLELVHPVDDVDVVVVRDAQQTTLGDRRDAAADEALLHAEQHEQADGRCRDAREDCAGACRDETTATVTACLACSATALPTRSMLSQDAR